MLNNLKIGKRLGIAFAVLLISMAVITAIGLKGMADIQDNLARIVTVNNTRSAHAHEAVNNMFEIMLAMRNVILEKEVAKKQEMNQRLQAARGKYAEALKKVEEMTTKDDTKGHEALGKVKAAIEAPAFPITGSWKPPWPARTLKPLPS